MSVFIEPFNFSFFSVTGRGIDLDYWDIEWFAILSGIKRCNEREYSPGPELEYRCPEIFDY